MVYVFEVEKLCEGHEDKILFEGSVVRGFIICFPHASL